MSRLSELESILFVASKPLSTKELAKRFELSEDAVRDMIETVTLKFNRDDSGIFVLTAGDSVHMSTNPANHEIVDHYVKHEISDELTKAQLETLTVVAYRGPITRPELEQIRGVNCSVILRNLLMRGLVEEKDDAEKLMPVYVLSTQALASLGVANPSEFPDFAALSTHDHIETQLKSTEE